MQYNKEDHNKDSVLKVYKKIYHTLCKLLKIFTTEKTICEWEGIMVTVTGHFYTTYSTPTENWTQTHNKINDLTFPDIV
jgi:hypothetical protein